MKVRNAMCIFALFSIIALFFCFGVVVNAAESGAAEPYTYELHFTRYSSGGNWQLTDYVFDTMSFENRICLLKGDTLFVGTNDEYTVYDFACLSGEYVSTTSFRLGYTLNRYKDNGDLFGDANIHESTTFSSIGAKTIETNIPIFNNDEAGKAAALVYLKTGTLPEEIEDEELEAPKLVFTTQNRVFHIANSVDGYNVQIQGRFYSVDDIEMEKKIINAGVSWNYKYHTTLMGDLTDWVSVSSQTSCKEEFDILKGIGLEPLKAFLTKYPLDDRTIYGGKNSAGAWYTDRDKAVTQLKLSLSSVGVGLTQPELYVRFFYTDADGNTRYSKWTHWYGVLTNPDGTKSDILSYQSDTGLSDEEKDNLEKGGKPTENDTGTTPTYRDNDNGTSFWFKDFNPSNILTYFTNLIKTLLSATSNIAPFFNSIFGFLPAELRNVVYVTISAGCFCALIRFIFGKG